MRRTVRRGTTHSLEPPQWRSWAIATAGVLLAFFMVNSGVRPLVACIHSAREVVYKTRHYERMVALNRADKEELRFRQTVEGKKRAAREELGYIDRDEELLEPVEEVPLEGDLRVGARFRTRLGEASSRARFWARDAADITRCMLGMWKPLTPEDETSSAQ